MTGESAGELNLERLLSDALRPIDPPEDLASRVETTLSSIAQQAAAELSSWADELSEGELDALRDPRNWVRPVAAVAAGGPATFSVLAFCVAAPAASPVRPKIRCRTLSSVLIAISPSRSPNPFSVTRNPQIASTRYSSPTPSTT